MKQITILILIVLGLFSCRKNEETSFTTETEISLEQLSEQLSSFKEIDSSGILLFPLLFKNPQLTDKDYYSKKKGKYQNTYYWNIAFYFSETQQTQLLTDKKVLIQDYKLMKVEQNKIFYTIISDDYNKDKALTDDDPIYLYVSDKKGQSFKQISPSEYHVTLWEFIEKSDKVVMLVQSNINKNQPLDSKDEIKVFEYNLKDSLQPREVFSTEFKNQIRDLYQRDWKQTE